MRDGSLGLQLAARAGLGLRVHHVDAAVKKDHHEPADGGARRTRPLLAPTPGLDPWTADVPAAENRFRFRAFFARLAHKSVDVKTRGAADFDAAARPTCGGLMHARDAADDGPAADAPRGGQVGPPEKRVR